MLFGCKISAGKKHKKSSFGYYPFWRREKCWTLWNNILQKVAELYRKYDESLYRRNFWNLEVPQQLRILAEICKWLNLVVNHQAVHFPLFLMVFILASPASQMLLQWTIKQDISRLFKQSSFLELKQPKYSSSELSSNTFPTVPDSLHRCYSSLSNAPPVNYEVRNFPPFLAVFSIYPGNNESEWLPDDTPCLTG